MDAREVIILVHRYLAAPGVHPDEEAASLDNLLRDVGELVDAGVREVLAACGLACSRPGRRVGTFGDLLRLRSHLRRQRSLALRQKERA